MIHCLVADSALCFSETRRESRGRRLIPQRMNALHVNDLNCLFLFFLPEMTAIQRPALVYYHMHFNCSKLADKRIDIKKPDRLSVVVIAFY